MKARKPSSKPKAKAPVRDRTARLLGFAILIMILALEACRR